MAYESLSVDELADLLVEKGFVEESEKFQENEIDGSVIEYITEDHLKEMGIELVGPRVLLMDFLNSLTGQNKPQQRPIPQMNESPKQAMQSSGPVRTSKTSSASKGAARPTTAQPQSNNGEKPKYVREHEKMVESMRAARKLAAYEKAVAEGRAVGPPPELPPIEEPEGLVQCPTCGRKMSEEAARHHFPVCERSFGKSNATRMRR